VNNNSTVLIVDDEEMVLVSIRAFLRLETDYCVQAFRDPEKAVEYLKNATADVVVSDYLMPKMNGIQFLKKAKELRPEATRMLLTGHADKQSAIQAINEVALYQYIEKPWENAALLMAIRNGCERAQLMRELRDSQSSLRDVRTRLIRAFL
jgi:DNA-binding NtrC family response regulator